MSKKKDGVLQNEILPAATPGIGTVKPPSFRVSAHYMDQVREGLLPEEPYQQSLLDLIKEKKIDEALFTDIQGRGIAHVGINLSPLEWRFMNSLLILLKEKSENKDTTSPDFYKGNYDGRLSSDWGEVKLEGPSLIISHAELYKAFAGHSEYSGSDAKQALKTLNSLAKRDFFIHYGRRYEAARDKKGKPIYKTDIISKIRPLLLLDYSAMEMSDEETRSYLSGDTITHKKKAKIIVHINPIVIDQIDGGKLKYGKYVSLPVDINHQIILAAGHKNAVTVAMTQMVTYFLTELSNGRHTFELNKDTLIKKIHLSEYKRKGRKQTLEKKVKDALDVCKKMELLTSHQKVKGREGQEKFIFTLNKDYL